MKRTIITITLTAALSAMVRGSFTLGAYLQWRRSNAFMAGQILVLDQMAVRGDDQHRIADRAIRVANQLETASRQETFSDMLRPSLIPEWFRSSTEDHMWQHNHMFMAERSQVSSR